MSSFLVEERTIKVVAGAILDYDRECTGKFGDFEETCRALLAMNKYALMERYGEEGENELTEGANYCFINGPVCFTKVEAYVRAKCLRYQCSEGDTETMPMYEKLNLIIENLAHEIIEHDHEEEFSTCWA